MTYRPVLTWWLFLVALGPWVGNVAARAIQFEPYVLRTFDGQQVEAELGRLRVPWRHERPEGPTIELAVIRLKGTAATPGPPLVHLVGGPGGAGSVSARTARFHALNELREVGDVIVLDQRGTGLSRPNPVCRERWDFPLDRPGDERAMLEHAIGVCRVAGQRLRDEAVDLDAFTTIENADDIESLRKALGVEKINLWGTSYGTHLALSFIRRHEKSVHRAILAGVEGPDHTLKLPSTAERQLATLDRLTKEDAELRRFVPDFLGLVRGTLARLEGEPVMVKLPSATGPPVAVTIGKFDLQLVTVNALGRTNTARMLPAMYYALSQGDFTAVGRQVQQLRGESVGSAMSFMMDCASGASPERLAHIHREAAECLLGDAANFPFPAINAAWEAPDLGTAFRAPVESTVPVLLVSGSLDSRTPPANAEEVRRGLPNSVHLMVEGAGHGEDLFSASAELRRRMVDFLRGQSVPEVPIAGEPFKFALPQPVGGK